MMLISLLSANTTRAEPKSCDQVLKLCDQALEDSRRETEALKKLDHSRLGVIEAQEKHILTQRGKIDLLEAENKSLLNDPRLWFVVGLGLGVYIMKK